MEIQSWPIGKVLPYGRNPRKISDKAIEKVAASIREFGFCQPIVVDAEGVIIVGHTRRLAAIRLKMLEVPVFVATGLTPEQVRAYRIADNRTGQEAKWDDGLLALELGDFGDLDIAITGFSPAELRGLLPPIELAGEDDAVSRPEEPVTQPGDLWILGPHRLFCGDSTDPDAVRRALGDLKPDVMITDPPYGVNYDPAWRAEYDHSDRHAVGKVLNDDQCDWTEAYRLFPGSVAYIWHASLFTGAVMLTIQAAGFLLRAQIIWNKQHFTFSRGAYHWKHEPCWYAVRDGSTASWIGDRKQTTVWDVDNLNPFGGSEEKQTGHGTQKPVELMRRPMLNHVEPGGAVYDPFLGSGSTLIAAESIGRVCCGLELDPGYCDMIVKRWESITGKKAVRG